MPPTRQLTTPCRYGYKCTRPDCFYTHPPGMKRDQQQLCSFGRSCFRKICHLEHPNGRMMDQLRPNLDQCAACVLVRPAELARVSAAFQEAFPAPTDGKERCDFVAAVPLCMALKDWKIYRGISMTGTPDGTPSEPERIRLFPRTRKGERLLQDPANRLGMRWSPTPGRPWKTLERMVTHDQHWEESQEFYVLCAGYQSDTGKSGVCMELMGTGMVQPEDGGDGRKAGERVAREVLGLPGAVGQRWFVFHVSRPDDPDEESQFVTVKTTVDVARLPALPTRPLHWPSAPAIPGPPAPPASTAGTRTAPPPAAPASRPAAAAAAAPPAQAARPAAAAAAAVAAAATTITAPTYTNPTSVAALQYGTAPASYASSSSPPVSTDSELGSSTLSFGSFNDGHAVAAGAAGTPLSRSAFPLGSGGGGGSGGSREGVDKAFAVYSPRLDPAPPAVVVAPAAAVAGGALDELSELLARLNMTKYRPKFDSKKVDFKTLKMMTEEDELSGIGIPLGPRIKLMKELGIERPFT